MTWKEFKQELEDAGVEDWMEIDYIDITGGSAIKVDLPATEFASLKVW